ncbi:MAG: hypothetical protein WDW38_010198 [Sanguina aurantia]
MIRGSSSGHLRHSYPSAPTEPSPLPTSSSRSISSRELTTGAPGRRRVSAVIVDTSNGSRSSTGIPTAVFASSGDGSSSRHLVSITAKLENRATTLEPVAAAVLMLALRGREVAEHGERNTTARVHGCCESSSNSGSGSAPARVL